MKTKAVVALAALALSGCASIFSGSSQEVAIRTTPGAMYKLIPNNIDAELEPIGQDVAELDQEHLMLEKAGSYSVSRHDYTARNKAREMDCAPMGSPAVDGINTPEESITFLCKDGRQLSMRCGSGRGCSAP